MTVLRSLRTQGAIQETAQALVAGGEVRAAVELLDRYLSQFDGDWGIWLYFAGLCARAGKRSEAVAAYRACARQLEADGHFERAREALRSATQLMPTPSLSPAGERVGERGSPAAAPKPKLPPAAVHLTAVIPGRKRRPAPPPPPPPPSEMTDPHCAIFDIIDAERDGRSNRVGPANNVSVVSARRGR